MPMKVLSTMSLKILWKTERRVKLAAECYFTQPFHINGEPTTKRKLIGKKE